VGPCGGWTIRGPSPWGWRRSRPLSAGATLVKTARSAWISVRWGLRRWSCAGQAPRGSCIRDALAVACANIIAQRGRRRSRCSLAESGFGNRAFSGAGLRCCGVLTVTDTPGQMPELGGLTVRRPQGRHKDPEAADGAGLAGGVPLLVGRHVTDIPCGAGWQLGRKGPLWEVIHVANLCGCRANREGRRIVLNNQSATASVHLGVGLDGPP